MWPTMSVFRAFSRTCFVNEPMQCFPLTLVSCKSVRLWVADALGSLADSDNKGADEVRNTSTTGRRLLN